MVVHYALLGRKKKRCQLRFDTYEADLNVYVQPRMLAERHKVMMLGAPMFL